MRVKGGFVRRRRRKDILRKAKGFRGSINNRYRVAKEAVQKAERYAYVSRRQKKRDIRKLWIKRINIAVRNIDPEFRYSLFIKGLSDAKIKLNRKMLADLAIFDKEAFAKLVETAKSYK
jgi:large subunit ribosomal protein L20